MKLVFLISSDIYRTEVIQKILQNVIKKITIIKILNYFQDSRLFRLIVFFFFFSLYRSARRITIAYCILICNALLVFFSIPLMSYAVNIKNDNQNSTIKFHLPFVASYPEFFYKSPIFEFVYLSQLLATSTCGIIILGTDTLIATAIFHTCGHFVILKKNLEKLVFSPITNIDSTEKIDKQINLIIKHHQIIIRYARVFNKTEKR